jgi:hypothetical protein
VTRWARQWRGQRSTQWRASGSPRCACRVWCLNRHRDALLLLLSVAHINILKRQVNNIRLLLLLLLLLLLGLQL